MLVATLLVQALVFEAIECLGRPQSQLEIARTAGVRATYRRLRERLEQAIERRGVL